MHKMNFAQRETSDGNAKQEGSPVFLLLAAALVAGWLFEFIVRL